MTSELCYLHTFHRFIFILQQGRGSLSPQPDWGKKVVLEGNTVIHKQSCHVGAGGEGEKILCVDYFIT